MRNKVGGSGGRMGGGSSSAGGARGGGQRNWVAKAARAGHIATKNSPTNSPRGGPKAPVKAKGNPKPSKSYRYEGPKRSAPAAPKKKK